ncbi:MAG: VCBS repeat-containing protein, partial [Planctomycetes bacterium]|nr:VCBS repeat-containing protein [Planctomycetota bacterium]
LWSTPFILDLGTGAQPDFTLIGRYSGDNLSTALAVGDVNGDGKNDLVATAWGSGPGWPGPVRTNAGEVNVIFGATFSGRYVWDLSVTPPDVRILGRAAGDRLGYGATLADLDGDGQLDIVAAAAEASPLDRNQAGTVHVFRGGAFSTTTTLDLSTTSADWEIDGAAAGDLTGRLALAAGDLNGDGQTDLAMGVPGATFGARSETGGVRLLHGGFTYLLDPPRVGTRMQIRLLARAYPGTFRLGAAALSGRLGVAIDATRTFPLDPDALLFASLSSPQLFVDYMGFLSASGEATASIAIPNLGTLAGITIYTAFVLLDPQAPASTAAVGNRVPVTFLP